MLRDVKNRRALLVALVLALAIVAAWLAGGGDRSEPPVASSPSAGADAGVPRAGREDHGEPPPKPPEVASARPDAPPPSYPWANEQPPPDDVGEPLDGGGRPMPAKAPPDYDVLDEAQLDARRRDTIAFLEERIEELERRAAHADETGQPELAATLRTQRDRIASRRDALRELVGP